MVIDRQNEARIIRYEREGDGGLLAARSVAPRGRTAMQRPWSADELRERWTLLQEDPTFFAGALEPGKLGLAAKLAYWRQAIPAGSLASAARILLRRARKTDEAGIVRKLDAPPDRRRVNDHGNPVPSPGTGGEFNEVYSVRSVQE